jgi:hypothetical protein
MPTIGAYERDILERTDTKRLLLMATSAKQIDETLVALRDAKFRFKEARRGLIGADPYRVHYAIVEREEPNASGATSTSGVSQSHSN